MCAQRKEFSFEEELFPADELEIKVIFVFVVVQHSVERFARLSGTRVRFADELHANGVGHVFGGVRHCGVFSSECVRNSVTSSRPVEATAVSLEGQLCRLRRFCLYVVKDVCIIKRLYLHDVDRCCFRVLGYRLRLRTP